MLAYRRVARGEGGCTQGVDSIDCRCSAVYVEYLILHSVSFLHLILYIIHPPRHSSIILMEGYHHHHVFPPSLHFSFNIVLEHGIHHRSSLCKRKVNLGHHSRRQRQERLLRSQQRASGCKDGCKGVVESAGRQVGRLFLVYSY